MANGITSQVYSGIERQILIFVNKCLTKNLKNKSISCLSD